MLAASFPMAPEVPVSAVPLLVVGPTLLTARSRLGAPFDGAPELRPQPRQGAPRDDVQGISLDEGLESWLLPQRCGAPRVSSAGGGVGCIIRYAQGGSIIDPAPPGVGGTVLTRPAPPVGASRFRRLLAGTESLTQHAGAWGRRVGV